MKTYREHKEEDASTQQQAENTAAFAEWIKKHPDVRDCDATRLAFAEYMEGEDIWTEADLEYALSRIPESRIVRQKVKSEAEIVAEENARRKALPMSELKTLARAEAPAAVAPTLPLEILLPGRKTATDISTADALKALARTNINAFKWLYQRYGSELMDARLGVQKKQQHGVSVRLPI